MHVSLLCKKSLTDGKLYYFYYIQRTVDGRFTSNRKYMIGNFLSLKVKYQNQCVCYFKCLSKCVLSLSGCNVFEWENGTLLKEHAFYIYVQKR